MTTLPEDLRPDCAACHALCCVVPAFDAAQGFGYDKPADTPCRHLQADFRCSIHARLIESGFPGCVRYDCYGAGQRAVREFADAESMTAAFARLRDLHELKAIVHFTLGRVDDAGPRAELHARLADIEALCRDAGSDAVRAPAATLRRATLTRLRELLPHPSSN